MSAGITLDKIEQFERLLAQTPQIVLKTEHEFCNGLYARTIHVPAGVALTGAIHRHENFFLVRLGEMAVWTEQGMRHVKAGDMFKSYPGIKRVGYAFSDTVITTFHANPTNETDPEEIWELFTVDTVEQLDFNVLLEIEG